MSCIQRTVRPGAAVLEGSRGAINLGQILDIEMPLSHQAAVIGHENAAIEASYIVSHPDNEETQPHRLQSRTASKGRGGSRKHLDEEVFSTVVFEADEPMSLAHLQDWLQHSASGVVRVKGLITFQEVPDRPFVFQLSGRRRCEMRKADRWHGFRQVQLVVIAQGVSLDKETVLRELGACCMQAPTCTLFAEAQVVQLKADARFEVHHVSESSTHFRLTGVAPYGVTVEQAQDEFGLDLLAMNHSLLNAVNSSSGSALLLLTEENNLCLATGCSDVVMEEGFQTVYACAESMSEEYLEALRQCKCGF